jgi:hypothetical protein
VSSSAENLDYNIHGDNKDKLRNTSTADVLVVTFDDDILEAVKD